MTNKTEQQELLQQIHQSNYDTFITLTFKWSALKKNADTVTPVLNALFRHVERQCYGRQADSNKIARLITLEYTASEGSHLHIALRKPLDKTHEQFKTIVQEKWKRLSGTGKSNLNNDKWYQQITDTDEDRKSVISYITKDTDAKYSNVILQCM